MARTKRQILNKLNAKLAKRKRATDKKKEKEKLNKEIELARKKLRGY